MNTGKTKDRRFKITGLSLVRVIRVMNEPSIRGYLSCDYECLPQIPCFTNLHDLINWAFCNVSLYKNY
jgi:hypothetical protein